MARRFQELSNKIEWTQLSVKYQSYIDLLTFTLEEQKRVAAGSDTEKTNWALKAMTPNSFNGLDFWLTKYDTMMQGDAHLRQDKPLLQLYKETRWEGKCDKGYTDDVEALWVETQVTQIRGHLAMMNAQDLLADNPAIVQIDAKRLMGTRKKEQQVMSGKITCSSFNVENTLNLEACEESHLGFGLIPKAADVELVCKPGYYPTQATVRCPVDGQDQTASCQACNCDPEGSISNTCADFTGTCQCKEGFYGDKCDSRDCKGHWGAWSRCPCGASKTQSRNWVVTTEQYGHGSRCVKTQETRSCFSGCCSYQFQCGHNHCIPKTKECDYK